MCLQLFFFWPNILYQFILSCNDLSQKVLLCFFFLPTSHARKKKLSHFKSKILEICRQGEKCNFINRMIMKWNHLGKLLALYPSSSFTITFLCRQLKQDKFLSEQPRQFLTTGRVTKCNRFSLSFSSFPLSLFVCHFVLSFDSPSFHASSKTNHPQLDNCANYTEKCLRCALVVYVLKGPEKAFCMWTIVRVQLEFISSWLNIFFPLDQKQQMIPHFHSVHIYPPPPSPIWCQGKITSLREL